MRNIDEKQYKAWRSNIIKRDRVCVLCKKPSTKIEIHHIETYIDNPGKRFAMSNGCVLCDDCHNKTKGKEKEYEEMLKKLIARPFKERNFKLRF